MNFESVPHLSSRQAKETVNIKGMAHNSLIPFPRYKYCRFSGAVSTGFESRAKNDVLLKDDHNFYNFNATNFFKLSFIDPSFNSYLATHTVKGASIETALSWQSEQFTSRSYLKLGLAYKCRTFHELTDEQLFKLDSKYLILMLKENFKFGCNEYRILEVVFKWMMNYVKKEANNINLRLHLMNIFHYIRFDEITDEDFTNLSVNIECSTVFDTFQIVFHSMKNDEKSNTKMIKSLGFPSSRGVEQALVQIDINDGLESICTMPMNKTSPEWKRVFDNIVEGFILEKWTVVHKNNLFVFGNAKTSEKTFQFGVKYCPLVNKWTKVEELEDGYEFTSLTAVGNCFIGIGTFDGETKKFAMKYDPNLNVWSKIEEMPVELHQYAAVAFDDTLFISGGKHNTNSESTNDFWMYSLTENSWTKLPNMNYKRSNHVMIRSNSKIYFFGDKLPIDKVECYDIITQTFQVITNLLTSQFIHDQLVFKNEFFINNEKAQPVFHSFELDAYKLMWGYFCNFDIHKYMYDSIFMYKT